MPKPVLIFRLITMVLSFIIVFGLIVFSAGKEDENPPVFSKSEEEGERNLELPDRITHAEFASIILPALGLDSRALKTATVEDKIDILESVGFAPEDGYQPDKILTVEETSFVLAKIKLARFDTVSEAKAPQDVKPASADTGRYKPAIQSVQLTKRLESTFSGANDEPVSTDELVAIVQYGAVQETVTVEAEATLGLPIRTTETVEAEAILGLPIRMAETVESRAALGLPILIQTEVERLLKERLLQYYRPLYTQPVSPTEYLP